MEFDIPSSIKCDQCDKEFKTEKALRGHKMGAHKVQKKDTPKEQTQAKAKETTTNQTPTEMTPEERAIAARVASQSSVDDWFAIGEESMNDFSLMTNPFDLPPEAAKLQNEKQYAFRYCERTPARIDELTRAVRPPLRWMLVTRNSMPVMAKYVDDIAGCVCKLDQALLFKPWSHHEIVKRAKADLAEASDGSGSLRGRKHEMQSKDDDIEVFEGKQYKINSGDQVMVSEDAMDNAMGVTDDANVEDLVIE